MADNAAWWCRKCSAWVDVRNEQGIGIGMPDADCAECGESVATTRVVWPKEGPMPPEPIPEDAEFIRAIIVCSMDDKTGARAQVVDHDTTNSRRGVFPRLLRQARRLRTALSLPDEFGPGIWVWEGWVWWETYQYFNPVVGEHKTVEHRVRRATEFDTMHFREGISLRDRN